MWFIWAVLATSLLSHAPFSHGLLDFDANCDGTVSAFNGQVQWLSNTYVAYIPSGYYGLQVTLTSNRDLDLRATNSNTDVVKRRTGVLSTSGQETATFQGDSITYSGYHGDGTGRGHEFIRFNDLTDNAYNIYIYNFMPGGSAIVTYNWTGTLGCPPGNVKGSGSFSQYVSANNNVGVGTIPAGKNDVLIKIAGSADIDIQLFDGTTKIVHYSGGLLNGATPATVSYGGATIQYSGYKGEQRAGTFGYENLFIAGTVPSDLTVQLYGRSSGSTTVSYNWGYYYEALGLSGGARQVALHNIIKYNKVLTYTPDCWNALNRIDQDVNNTNNIIGVYSRQSIPKSWQDNGNSPDTYWNREHAFPKALGNYDTTMRPGTDIHALRAENKVINSNRGTKDYAKGGTAVPNCQNCFQTTNTWEPPDVSKGELARNVFYMATRYNGDSYSGGISLRLVNSKNTALGAGELGYLPDLKIWNSQFPPSGTETQRNNLVFEIQGNRNPFIDHPEWVNEMF